MKFILISSCVALLLIDFSAGSTSLPGPDCDEPIFPIIPVHNDKPAILLRRNYSMSLDRNNNYSPNALVSIANTFRKYSRFAAVSEISAISRAIANLTATVYGNDIEYYATVSVGTPSQNFKLNFDTGSADLWFASTLCLTSCVKHNRYNSTLSRTYKPDGRPWMISYGDGSSASGVLAYDTVTLQSLAIKNQTIELAVIESAQFSNDVIDGILGLSFDTIASVAGTKTPMDNLISQGLLTQPIFSVSLVKASKSIPSQYLFGAIDTTKYTGALKTVPVNSSYGFWLITVNGISIKTTSISSSFRAIIDTGTTLLVLPQAIADSVAKFYKATSNGDGTYNISCNTATLSPLIFNINGATFTIPVDSLIYQQVGTRCYAGFGYAGFDFAILGDVFIKNNYVVFNPTVPQVQIAKSKYQ